MAGTEQLHPLMETALALAAVHQPAGVLQSLWVGWTCIGERCCRS